MVKDRRFCVSKNFAASCFFVDVFALWTFRAKWHTESKTKASYRASGANVNERMRDMAPENLWLWWWSWVLVVQHHPGPLVHFNIISCWFFLLLPLPFYIRTNSVGPTHTIFLPFFRFLSKKDPKKWMPLYVIFCVCYFSSSLTLALFFHLLYKNCVRFSAIESHSKMLNIVHKLYGMYQNLLTLFIYGNSTRNSIKTGLHTHIHTHANANAKKKHYKLNLFAFSNDYIMCCGTINWKC